MVLYKSDKRYDNFVILEFLYKSEKRYDKFVTTLRRFRYLFWGLLYKSEQRDHNLFYISKIRYDKITLFFT